MSKDNNETVDAFAAGKAVGRKVSDLLAKRRESLAAGPRSVSELARVASVNRGTMAAVFGGAARLGVGGITVETIAAALEIEPAELSP